MIGYIYKTTNLINGRIYIGKHQSKEYDSKYYGSGKLLEQAILKYGKINFKNEVLYEADSIDDLNEKEKFFIKEYRKKYGDRFLYNIANGGDGGDVISRLPEEERNAFVRKMTEINQKRCKSDSFRENTSSRMSQKYLNQAERKLQSEKVKNGFKNMSPDRKKEWMDKRQKFISEHPGYWSDYKKVPCWFELGDIKIRFDSKEDLKAYLKSQWSYSPDYRTLKKMLEDGAMRIPRKFFHKNYKRLDGMMVYLDCNESVETKSDECSSVGNEIGTFPKCKTKQKCLEEIVRPV